jgi:ATP-dependent helicase/nuclease subunit B
MAARPMGDEMHMIANTLVKEMSEVCRGHLLDEKWLIAPSLRAGNDWLLAVVRAGQPVVNGHARTVAKLALDLAGPVFAEEKLTLITGRQGVLLIDRVIRNLRKRGQGYLSRISPSVRLAEAVFRAVDAFRRAGLGPSDLRDGQFEVPEKGRELREILRGYVAELDHGKWIDRAGVLERAIERLETDSNALAANVIVLVPENAEAAGLEGRLLAALPEVRRKLLRVDHAGTTESGGVELLSDAALLRWVLSPVEAPTANNDGTAQVFRAIGEINEIREVLRRCARGRIPLDQVELLCTDIASYGPLVFDTFAQLAGSDQKLDDLPVTFQDGISARQSRPGRALIGWLRWVRDDFPQRGLVQMIQEGLLRFVDHDLAKLPFQQLARVLRGLEIGFGRERYLAVLERHEKAAAAMAVDVNLARDEDGEVDYHRARYEAERAQALRSLRDLIEPLLVLSSGADASAPVVLERALKFLRVHSRQNDKLDEYACTRLQSAIKEVYEILKPEEGTSGIDAFAWLAELPDQVKVNAQGPRGGRLHVAPILAGGHSGRPYTFIVGLDDSRFPGARLQDPILLDVERRGLSPELETSADHLDRRMKHMARLFARLRGTVTLSYSCYNLIDDRDTFPSSIVLNAYRILSGERNGDHAALARWVGPAASFAPSEAGKALTESEWWLWRLSGAEQVAEPERLIGECYPHLARGFELARSRKLDEFGIFDGWIPARYPELDFREAVGPTVSASKLETLGTCPLKYFFRYVLEIKPPEEIEIDRDAWLDPLSRGSLLHAVFEAFFKERDDPSAPIDPERDGTRLKTILERQIAIYKNKIPPPSDAVLRREVSHLERTARIFLAEELDYRLETGNRPSFFEVSVGLEPSGSGSVLDLRDPVRVSLPGGGTLRMRGRIDRVDRVAGPNPNEFLVWDYKTGSTWKYDQEPRPFWEGRVVQHALYLKAMKALLEAKAKDFPGARADRFGYFFPSEKASGERIEFSVKELAGGGEILARLAEIAASGAFVATNNAKIDCRHCDYLRICGDVTALAAATDRKLRKPSNTILAPFAELRGNAKATE